MFDDDRTVIGRFRHLFELGERIAAALEGIGEELRVADSRAVCRVCREGPGGCRTRQEHTCDTPPPWPP